MKTLRIITVLLVALAAAACADPVTGPTLEASKAEASMEGTGYMGGGTRAP